MALCDMMQSLDFHCVAALCSCCLAGCMTGLCLHAEVACNCCAINACCSVGWRIELGLVWEHLDAVMLSQAKQFLA